MQYQIPTPTTIHKTTDKFSTQTDTSAKSWVFNCHDFSDGEVKVVQCAVKFKTQEIADAFRDAINNAKALHVAALASSGGETKTTATTTEEEDLAAIDAEVVKRNNKEAKRRGSATAQSALADSDYDSNEEDVDEGNEAALRAQYGIAKEGEAATTAAATESVTDAMAKASIKE